MKKNLTITLTIGLLGFIFLWDGVGDATRASIAVNQVNDSIVEYSAAQKLPQVNTIKFFVFGAYLVCVGGIWYKTIINKVK